MCTIKIGYISIAQDIIIIKSEVSTLPIAIIFFCGYVLEMFVTSHSVTYCIYIPGKPGFCIHYYCAVYDECKESEMFWLADRSCLFVHHTISLSSQCKPIWRQWTHKIPVRYILLSVWVRLSIFSHLSIINIWAVCFQFTHFTFDGRDNLYILSYYHNQIRSIKYYPLFRVRSRNYGIRCMYLYSYQIILNEHYWNHGWWITYQANWVLVHNCR